MSTLEPAVASRPAVGPDRPAGRSFAAGPRFTALVVALVVAAFSAVAVGVAVGPVTIGVPDVGRVLLAHLTGGDATTPAAVDQIVWDVRLPRVLLAAVVGAALAGGGHPGRGAQPAG